MTTHLDRIIVWLPEKLSAFSILRLTANRFLADRYLNCIMSFVLAGTPRSGRVAGSFTPLAAASAR